MLGLLAFAGGPRAQAEGAFDPAFHAPVLDAKDDVGLRMTLLSDGRILVFQQFSAIGSRVGGPVARLNTDGSVDTTFSFRGKLSNVFAAAELANGQVLLSGLMEDRAGRGTYRVLRVHADGSVDPAFDAGQGANELVRGMAVQPDGKVLLAGTFTTFSGLACSGVVRLQSDGALDLSFRPPILTEKDASGYVIGAFAVPVLQPDGRILVGGYFREVNGLDRPGIARLNSDGTLDETFVPAGYQLLSSRPVRGLAFDPDGCLLACGRFYLEDDTTTYRPLIRFAPDGQLDAQYRTVFATGIPSLMRDLRVLADGSVIGVARWALHVLTDGTLDPAFQRTPFGDSEGYTDYDIIYTMGVQSDGKVLVAGQFKFAGEQPHDGIARLNADGSLDPSFDTGRLRQPRIVNQQAGQPDGRIIVAGDFDQVDGVERLGLARLNADGTLDRSFNPAWLPGDSQFWEGFTVFADGSLFAYGRYGESGLPNRTYLRLTAEGTLDDSYATDQPETGRLGGAVALPNGKVLLHYGSPAPAFMDDALAQSIVDHANGLLGRLNSLGRPDADFSLLLDTSFVNGDLWSDEVTIRAPVPRPLWTYPDGSCLVTYANDDLGHVLARLTPDGALDPEFVRGRTAPGQTNESFAWVFWNGQSRYATLSSPTSAGFMDVAVQANGKILLVGEFLDFNGQARNGIVRLDANGRLDPLFHHGAGPGWSDSPTSTNRLPRVEAVEIQPDGAILIAGSFDTFDGVPASGVARLFVDGTLDESFQPGVRRLKEGPAASAASQLTSLPDGSYLLAGPFSSDGNPPARSLTRLVSGPVTTELAPETVDGLSVAYYVTSASRPEAIGYSAITTYQQPNYSIPRRGVYPAEWGTYTYERKNSREATATSAATEGTSKGLLRTISAVFLSPHSGTFSYVAFGGGLPDESGSGVFTTYKNQAPSISVQPTDLTTSAYADVELAADVLGFPVPSLQWDRNGAPIPGATNAMHTLYNVQARDAGVYRLTATNAVGTAVSRGAVLTVIAGPALEEALDTTGLVWATNPEYPWFGQTAVTHDGVDAARCNAPTNMVEFPGGEALWEGDTNRPWIETTVTGPGTLTYWWRITSTDDGDELVFSVNGMSEEWLSLWSGNGAGGPVQPARLVMPSEQTDSGWQMATNRIDHGTATLRWVYARWSEFEPTDGRGWLDQVTFVPDPQSAPVITSTPAAATVREGGTASFYAEADGNPFPVRWWQRDGQDLAGTEGFYTFRLEAVKAADAGLYRLAASNSLGVVYSEAARLTVLPATTLPGALDRSFVASGIPSSAYLYAVGVQPDGKVVVGGDGVLARFHPDGRRDTNFTPALTSGSLSYFSVSDLAFTDNGAVLITGDFTAGNPLVHRNLARLTPDGSVDETFIGNLSGRGRVLALAPDTTIVVGGDFGVVSGYSQTYVTRLIPNGEADPAFLNGDAPNGRVTAIAVQSDNRILIGGEFTQLGAQWWGGGTYRNHLARLLPNGKVDTSFDPGGGITGGTATVLDLAIQPDGKILVIGGFTSHNGTSARGIVRLNADGTIDPSFQSGSGFASNFEPVPSALVIQPDGKVVVVGSFRSYNGVMRNGIVRLMTDGAVDAGFDPGLGADPIYAAALLPNTRLVVAGGFESYDTVPCNRLARIYGGEPNSPPAIVIEPADQSVVGGRPAALSATASGTEPLFYQWLKDGVAITGATNDSLAMAAVRTVAAGHYQLRVTNAFGMVLSRAVELVVDPGVIAHWPLDGTGENVTTNGLNGELRGPCKVVPGRVGQAIECSAGAWVNLGDYGLNWEGPITMAAWVRPTQTNSTQNILAHGYATNPPAEVFLRLQNGAFQAGSWDGTNSVAASTPLPLAQFGQWTHLAGVYDGQRWLLYTNGVLAATKTSAKGSVPVNADWAIGARGGGGERYFKGAIDDVQLYARALSVEEIRALPGGPGLNPPVLERAPVDALAVVGQSATFSVVASGDAPLSYQWLKDGQPMSDTPLVTGSGAATLQFSRVTLADAGAYSVVITNPAGSITGAPAQLTVDNARLAHWALNGNGEDLETNHYVGELRGPLTTVLGRVGLAAGLAAGAYIHVPNATELNWEGPITMAAWIKPAQLSGTQNILAHGYATNPPAEVFLRLQSGVLQAGSWDGVTVLAVGATLPPEQLGRWTHLAGVYDGRQWLLYTNGVLAAAKNAAKGSVLVNADWAIGARGGGGERYFKGTIDEVQLYARALSAEEIRALPGAPGVEAPLLSVAVQGSELELRLTGTPGTRYRVEATTSLGIPIGWQTMEELVLTEATQTWTLPATTLSTRYFRARSE